MQGLFSLRPHDFIVLFHFIIHNKPTNALDFGRHSTWFVTHCQQMLLCIQQLCLICCPNLSELLGLHFRNHIQACEIWMLFCPWTICWCPMHCRIRFKTFLELSSLHVRYVGVIRFIF